MTRGEFTLDDFMAQMARVKELGPMGKVMGSIPGMGDMMKRVNLKKENIEQSLERMRAIYLSMTHAERENPDAIDHRRRRRIAEGAGVDTDDVSRFIKDFEQSRDVMRAVHDMGIAGRRKLDKVLGLVTDNPSQRDPSYVHGRHSSPGRLLILALSIAASVLLVFLASGWFARR